MKTRKLLVILLALLFVFGMSATAFAVDDDPADEDGAAVTETSAATDDEAVVDEETATDENAVTEETPESDFVIPDPGKVVVSSQNLMIDGESVEAEAYNIDGANYFKLRDLAALLTGSGSQFNVTYEAPNIIVTVGEEYTAIDGDLAKGEDKSALCVPSTQVLVVDGEQVDILVYNIGGNNFFQLRGLGELVGFSVDYDDASRTMIVESEGYVAPDEAVVEEGEGAGEDAVVDEGDDEGEGEE